MPVLPNPPGRGRFSPSQPPAAPQKRHRAAVRARGRRPSCLRAAGSWHPGEERATVPLLYLQSLPTPSSQAESGAACRQMVSLALLRQAGSNEVGSRAVKRML